MAAGRKLAQGTKLKMGDGAGPEVFATIAFLDTISLPNQTREAVNVSDHDTEDFMEFLGAALADGGEVSFEGHLDPETASHGYSAGSGILNAFKVGANKNFEIVSPNGVWKVSFNSVITAVGGNAAAENGSGKLRLSGTLKVSGEPIFAAVA